MAGIGAKLVRLAPDGPRSSPCAVRDVDGVYRAYLDALNASAVLVRPDYHVFGTAGYGGIAALVDGLRAQLHGGPI